MSEAPVQPDVHAFPRMQGVGADGFVNIDVACRSCGYDLRALSADAKCPECGTDVVGSLRSEQLCDADPVWVRRLGAGAQCIGLTLIVHLTLSCFTRGFAKPADLTPRVIDVACLVPWIIGVWLMTRPDPSGRGEKEYGRLRRAWWSSAIAVAVIDCIELTVALGNNYSQQIQAVQSLAYGVTAYIGLQFLSKLARRVADVTLAWQAKGLSITFALCYAALALFLGFDRTLTRNLPNAGILCFSVLFFLGFLISQFAYLGFLSRIADRLRIQSLMARDQTEANEKAHG